MLLTIDTHGPKPIYQQVADGINDLIARGTLAEGAPPPPVRQLAADLGANLGAIATAYRSLQEQGLTAVKHGSGTTVASRRSAQRRDTDLVRPLRTALTNLVLAGLSPDRIARIVMRELKLVTQRGVNGASRRLPAEQGS